jgi:hypothetical protein
MRTRVMMMMRRRRRMRMMMTTDPKYHPHHHSMADINGANVYGFTPLMYAAMNEHRNVAELLLKR